MAKEKTKIIRIRESVHKKLTARTIKTGVSIVGFSSDAIIEKIKKEARMK